MQGEASIKQQIMIALTQKHNARVFVNTVGKAWFGKFIRRVGDVIELLGGRCYDVGLYEGSPDLIGWLPVVVTQSMVGKTIAVFVGIETKTKRNKESAAQEKFLARLQNDGAIVGTARSVEDAVEIITSIERR